MLASPLLIRALEALVDKAILARPDFAQASQRWTNRSAAPRIPMQLIDAALDSVRATLRVDARWVEAARTRRARIGHVKSGRPATARVTASHQARTLMQQVAFLESVGTQLEHRLDAMHFEAGTARAACCARNACKRLLTEAELKALRTQVDPHFLFNTLNTIADLISTNPQQAERMTERLAECFRYALAKHSREPVHSRRRAGFRAALPGDRAGPVRRPAARAALARRRDGQ